MGFSFLIWSYNYLKFTRNKAFKASGKRAVNLLKIPSERLPSVFNSVLFRGKGRDLRDLYSKTSYNRRPGEKNKFSGCVSSLMSWINRNGEQYLFACFLNFINIELLD